MTLEKIRLEPSEIVAITNNFRKCFTPDDHLWIFGSRVNLKARGGDIDLYIETTLKESQEALERQNNLLYALYEDIGVQKIDLVVNLLISPTHLPIYDIAKAEGIQLV